MDNHPIEIVVHDSRSGAQKVYRGSGPSVSVGREGDNQVVLQSTFVSRRQLTIRRTGSKLVVENIGTQACQVDDGTLERGESRPLVETSEVRVAEFSLHVRDLARDEPARATSWQQASFDVVGAIHAELVRRLEVAGSDQPTERELVDRQLEAILDGILAEEDETTLAAVAAAALYARAVSGERNTGEQALRVHEDELDGRTRRLMASLGGDAADRLDRLERCKDERLPLEADQLDQVLRDYTLRTFLRDEIRALIFGFGPLERLLQRGDVTEIMVVGHDRIYAERSGIVELTGQRFVSKQTLVDVIQRMVAPLGRRVDRSSPLVDGRLPAGYRVNAVIDPIAVSGPYLTIRKFPERPFTLDDLIAKGSITTQAAAFLRACVAARKNIVVVGGTGSGKTTLLNVLTAFIGNRERIVTVEDSAELRLLQEHVATLETRPANLEGQGAISIRDLVRNALRMRPDRIIVGECRGDEAVDMLAAMNTGHAGSMTTLHANSSQEAMRRLENMILGVHGIPLGAVREQIAGAIDLVVYIGRLSSGARRIQQITEVVSVDPDTSDLVLSDLFTAEPVGDDLQLVPSGRLPGFAPELVSQGLLDAAEMLC